MKNLDINEYKKKKFNNNLMLFFTGISRFSGKYAAAQIKNTNKNYNELNKISEITKNAIQIFRSYYDFRSIGELMDESWNLKKFSKRYL